MIQISDYPNQCEFSSQENFEALFNKMFMQVKEGSLKKETIKNWKAENDKALTHENMGIDTVESLKLQNAIYNELLEVVVL